MRIIAHFDMDAFFASIEERDNERFKGMPVVVGADPRGGNGRGVVSTANYKAREYGIHSAQPITVAWQLSEAAKRRGRPAAIFMGVNMEKYANVSEKVMATIQKHILMIEEAGIDEAYGDLSFAGSYAKAEAICKKIKAEIKKEEKLTISVGIAPNKFIAKIASGLKKPDGLAVIKENEVEEFLAPLSVRQIPGVGPKTEILLQGKRIKLVKDLKKFSREELVEWLGKWGSDLYDKVRGKDDSPIVEECTPKSVGEEETFLEDSKDPGFVSERLLMLGQGAFRRFKKSGFKSFKTITIKIRFSDFETKTHSYTLGKKASTLEVLQFEILRLFLPFLDKRKNPRGKAIRLIGVRLEKLS
ncbi:MAG: DNA polymerase IV [Candidatus Colwellbacteria bacterium]